MAPTPTGSSGAQVYLDHAATTPMHPAAIEAMTAALATVGNASSLHGSGRLARRRAREERVSIPIEIDPPDEDFPEELRAALDEELARMPARHRAAVVLCELEGLSRRAAAQRLGIPQGTLASRLARAKDELRHRLVRRGMALSAIALDAGLAREAGARTLVISSSLVDSTIRAATRIAAGASLAEVTSTSVASLTQGVLKAMLLTKTKGVLFGLATAAVITTGVWVLAQTGVGGRAQVPASPDSDRLGVLERKLDQILEALGGSRQAATTGRGRAQASCRSRARSPPWQAATATQSR